MMMSKGPVAFYCWLATVVWLLAVLIFVVACGATPVSNRATNNPDVPVALLFEVDGCRVYRFEDAREFHYFTDCRGSVSSTHIRYCGKNCYSDVTEEVTTTERGEPR